MGSSVLCVIMGGGRGTRLQPLTRLRAKPAVPLAGKYRLVDIPISNCLNSGYNRIFLLTQFNTASGRPDMGIGAGSVIRKAIIDKNARIGTGVRLSPSGLPDGWERGDIVFRDGILVVIKNGVIADGTRVGEAEDRSEPEAS